MTAPAAVRLAPPELRVCAACGGEREHGGSYPDIEATKQHGLPILKVYLKDRIELVR